MAKLTSSNEFASLVSKLQQTPEDPYLKKQIMELFPQMKEWAKNDAMTLYHLAQVYVPGSPQYRKTMFQAADLGCTNAMLEAYNFLAKSKKPEDKEKSLDYLRKIEASQDSYIIGKAEKLVLDQIQQEKINVGKHEHGFFTAKPDRRENDAAPEVQEFIQP
jgi:hypothetical protein